MGEGQNERVLPGRGIDLGMDNPGDIEQTPSSPTQATIKTARLRRFLVERIEDATGTSGVGIVAEGVEFSNGKCAITWKSDHGVVSAIDNIKCIKNLHGHAGKSRVVWLDPEVL